MNGKIEFNWIRHESDMNSAYMEIWLNPAWKRHESDSMEIWSKQSKKSDKICVNGVLDWWFGILGCRTIEEIHSCWIHALPQNGWKHMFFETKNPNRQSKPLQKILNILQFQDKFGLRDGVEFMLISCWIHAEFMHNQTWNVILPLVSESCWFHASSVMLRFGGIGGFFQDFGANLVGGAFEWVTGW